MRKRRRRQRFKSEKAVIERADLERLRCPERLLSWAADEIRRMMGGG